MKNRGLVSISLTILCGLIYSDIFASGVKYNRKSAVDYAKVFSSSGSYNSDKYKCFNAKKSECENFGKSYGSDCANFMSQALVDGGLNFDCLFGKGKGNKAIAEKREFVEGSVVIGKDAKTAGIRSANDLYTALEDSFCFKKVSASEAVEGDIAAWRVKGRNWVHHVVMLNEEGYYAGHTSDVSFEAKQKPKDYVDEHKIEHVVSFYHFQDDDKCKKCDQNQKTCKAELVAKCNQAENCIPETGTCEPKCKNALGRCSPKVGYDAIMEMCLTGQGGDCPDDTFTVGSGMAPEPAPEVSLTAEIGILESGFTYDAVSLLQSFNETARIVQIGDISAEMVEDMPLLIIPSGGLYGLEKSEFFRMALEDYVNNGGTVFVLSQQHGYEYSAIPGGLSGYGWLEDQSCQTNSSYIDTWHPVLAGQTRSTPSINVDGYFTQYPEDTMVLLRRTSNGQAALLLYPYGSGYIMATSAYTDSAYTRGESLEDEKKLMRDIVAWAKYPASLPEARPGESISVDFPIENTNDLFTSVGVDIVLYDPDGNFLKREAKQLLPLQPGESTFFPVTHTVQQDAKLGIYQIKHELYTEDWILWPSEENPDGDSVWTDLYFHGSIKEPLGRFVVSNPPPSQSQINQMTFSIQADAEHYPFRGIVNLTVLAFNSSDVERTITAKFGSQTQSLVVPAQGSSSFLYSTAARYDFNHYGQWWGRDIVNFYEGERHIRTVAKMYRVYPLSANVSVQTDKTVYAKGETVTINASIKNNIAFTWQANVEMAIWGPDGKIFEDTKMLVLAPSGTGSVSTSFTLPLTSTLGSYWVSVDVPVGDWWHAGRGWTGFDLPQSQISGSPNLPSAFKTGTNTIPFTISNTGKISVCSGNIEFNLKAQDGSILDSGSEPFTLAIGETKTIEIPISIPSLKLGRYTFTYTLSDETRTGRLTSKTIRNSFQITSVTVDKSSYKIRETANLVLDLANTGNFDLDPIVVNVSSASLSFADIRTIALPVNSSTEQITYKIPIPETVGQGRHDVYVVATLPWGDSFSRYASIFVPPSVLSIVSTGSVTPSAGDNLEFIVRNTGGVDTDYNIVFDLLDSKGGVDSKSESGSIRADSQNVLSYVLPDQLLDGSYDIIAEVSDLKTNLTTYPSFPFTVSGLRGGLSVMTDNEVYFSNEATNTLSQIITHEMPIIDGRLHLQIVCGEAALTPPVGPPVSFHIYTEENYDWVERGVLHFPAEYEQMELSLPISPDQWGETLLKIEHEGAQFASVDYIALKDGDGNIYAPYYVGIPEQIDFTPEAQAQDEFSAEVSGQYFFASWSNLPNGGSYTLVITALERNACGIVWETDQTVNQSSGATETLNLPSGVLGQTGKYYLKGTLSNSYGQVIEESLYPFYIIDGDTMLQFSTDKDIYRPGETVTITGRIQNRAEIEAVGLTFSLDSNLEDQDPESLFTETFSLPAGEEGSFSVTTTAGEEGIVNITGAVRQNAQTLVSIRDQFEVASPVVSCWVDMPEEVGNEPFSIWVELYNEGRTDATVQFGIQNPGWGDSQTVILAPLEGKIIQYQQQIIQDTTYTITLAGDYEETFSYTVSYGLGASIQIELGSTGAFPEGTVAVPVILTNTGQMEESLEVVFQLTSQNSQPVTINRTYYLALGTNTSDTVYFNLTEGSYEITASSQLPAASVQAAFSVRKENQVNLEISSGTQADGLVPVSVILTNIGFNLVEGVLKLSLLNSEGTEVWYRHQEVSLPSSSDPSTQIFTLNPSGFDAGDYTLKAELLNNSNQQISFSSSAFSIRAATFQITQVPSYQTFYPGQEAAFVIKVKNTGDQEGAFDLGLKAYDLINSQTEWLKAGEERTVSFVFMLPEDLEEKDYFAEYELRDSPDSTALQAGKSGTVPQKGQIKYHLAGINLSVDASLDKDNYNEGETAHLTLSIQSDNPNPQNLFARVNYAGFEPQQTFTLTGSQVLIFDIPLARITGEKAFYGIYHESGRSIHLNSTYIHKAGDVITITTDKQVYNPGENVSVSVSGTATGNLTLSGPGGYTEPFPFSDNATISLTLPSSMTAGTYFINAQIQTPDSGFITAVHPLDVAGIQVKMLECENDKGKYASSDLIATILTISSNTAMPATLKTWIVDPKGQYAGTGEQSITLSSRENLIITHQSPLAASVSGIHRLVYGIYASDDMLLVSGSEAFDVGDAVLMGLSTDKVDYPLGNESVLAKVNLFGSVTAALEIFLDEQPTGPHSVSLDGFSTLDYILPSVGPGFHIIKAVLTAGGLSSTKEVSFTYGSGLPDLVVELSRDQDIAQLSLHLNLTAANQGKSPSRPTTLSLYDGEVPGGNLLVTFVLESLTPGQSQVFTYDLNLLGRAGNNTLYGLIDSSNSVYEFIESNNTGQITFAVPDLVLSTTLDKETYFRGETVSITSLITNLSNNPLTDLVLTTTVKDSSNTQIFSDRENIPPIERLAAHTMLTDWLTDINLPEGGYTVTQEIEGKEVSTQKIVMLIEGKDFSIATDTAAKSVEIGETAEYLLTLTPLKGFTGEISLSVSGYPQGASAYFIPNPAVIAGGAVQSVLKVIPAPNATPGTYPMNVSATGGEVRHDLDLSLNMTDFEIVLTPETQTVHQLERGVYTIDLNPLSGFDHQVTLLVNDLPRGMRASLSVTEAVPPQNITLTLETSKWLLPAEYRITVSAHGKTVTHTVTAALDVYQNSLITPRILAAPGPGPRNGAIIRTFETGGEILHQFEAFDREYGANVTAGDVDGDGIDEIIVGTVYENWRKPALLGIFQRDGTPMAVGEIDHWDKEDGVVVAAGDVDQDWIEEVAVGSCTSFAKKEKDGGKGRHPHKGLCTVRIYKIVGDRFIDTGLDLSPYDEEQYRKTPNIALADVDGDGVPEIITAPGPDPDAAAEVRVFRIDTEDGVGRWKIAPEWIEFFVPFKVKGPHRKEDYHGHVGFGANIAAGDIDGDGRSEIIVGAGPDPDNRSIVKVYSGDGRFTGIQFEAYPESCRRHKGRNHGHNETEYSGYGAYVAAGDIDQDGIAEIMTGTGPGPENDAWIRIFRGDGTSLGDGFLAYPGRMEYGVKPSGMNAR